MWCTLLGPFSVRGVKLQTNDALLCFRASNPKLGKKRKKNEKKRASSIYFPLIGYNNCGICIIL